MHCRGCDGDVCIGCSVLVTKLGFVNDIPGRVNFFEGDAGIHLWELGNSIGDWQWLPMDFVFVRREPIFAPGIWQCSNASREGFVETFDE